ncbi:uncharacterized protein FPOAC1_013878 [Fusarium poae]|uniref:uncharacterized protein n=1 Tax=Fusarium poae TaxID=36050 RepID=UPI001D04BF8B|nr:uncharacterized protein FPOAC1_013878 [Fusarium poae]KAG8664171.1 hypothetical protein FPOAC1_013878 [Fusarium poae]
MTEDIPVYAAALLLDPSKRKSYIEECWPEEWHEGAFAAARCLWKEEYNHDVEIHLSEQSLAVPTLLKRKKDTMLSKMRLEQRWPDSDESPPILAYVMLPDNGLKTQATTRLRVSYIFLPCIKRTAHDIFA